MVVVLLSGCGVYDGAEIQESVLTLLALKMNNIDYQCIAPDINQHHVIDHTTGNELNETRNVKIEAARIARGDIKSLEEISMEDYKALVIPGGFGSAKNLTNWAFKGPEGEINEDVKRIILQTHSLKKPIVAMCMSPVALAKAFEGTGITTSLTVGTTEESSPYEIKSISQGMELIGAKAKMNPVSEITIDIENQLITTPCYMMNTDIVGINVGINKAIEALSEFI